MVAMPSIFRRETLWRAAALFSPIFYWVAFAWRRMLPDTTVIAITGSLGKTTTKELLADILASVAPTYRTHRNQNSPTLVTLNVLRMRRRHRYAVFEIAGASPGTLRRPARLVRPMLSSSSMFCGHTARALRIPNSMRKKKLFYSSVSSLVELQFSIRTIRTYHE